MYSGIYEKKLGSSALLSLLEASFPFHLLDFDSIKEQIVILSTK